MAKKAIAIIKERIDFIEVLPIGPDTAPGYSGVLYTFYIKKSSFVF
jgi:hypothetical protein